MTYYYKMFVGVRAYGKLIIPTYEEWFDSIHDVIY